MALTRRWAAVVFIALASALTASGGMAQEPGASDSIEQRLQRYEQRLGVLESRGRNGTGGDWTDTLRVHGFLSAGALRSDLDAQRPVGPGATETTDISSPEGATRNWSHQGLSRAGLQVSATTSEDTEVVVQLLSKGVDEFDTEAQWAYFSYAVTPSLKVRGGRLTIPFYMHSQYINVGYAYPWVVPPQEVYNTVPADRFEGFDLLWDFSTGQVANTLNLLWGSTDVRSDLANQATRFRVENLGVVMSADAPVDALTEAEVRQLFTGVTRTVKNHSFAPLDLPDGSEVRERFYRRLTGKSPQQMKAWWARMIFTGKGHPLREVSSSKEQILLVQSADDYIGYMDSEQLVDSLKVVFRFPE